MRAAVEKWLVEADDDVPYLELPQAKKHKTASATTTADEMAEKERAIAWLTVDEAVEIALAASAYSVDKHHADLGIEDALKRGNSFARKIVEKAQALKVADEDAFDAKAMAAAFA